MSDPLEYVDQETVNQLDAAMRQTIKDALEFSDYDPRKDKYLNHAETIQKILADAAEKKGLKPVKPIETKPQNMNDAIRMIFNRGNVSAAQPKAETTNAAAEPNQAMNNFIRRMAGK